MASLVLAAILRGDMDCIDFIKMLILESKIAQKREAKKRSVMEIPE